MRHASRVFLCVWLSAAFCALQPLVTRAGQTIWTEPEILGESNAYAPEIAVDAAGGKHVLYVKNGHYAYATWRPGMLEWRKYRLCELYDNTVIQGDLFVAEGGDVFMTVPTGYQGSSLFLYGRSAGSAGGPYLHSVVDTVPPGSGSVGGDQTVQVDGDDHVHVYYTRLDISRAALDSCVAQLVHAEHDGQAWHHEVVHSSEDGEFSRPGQRVRALHLPNPPRTAVFHYGLTELEDPLWGGFPHGAWRFTGTLSQPGAPVVSMPVDTMLDGCYPPEPFPGGTRISCSSLLPATTFPSVTRDAFGGLHVLYYDVRNNVFRTAASADPDGAWWRFRRLDVDADVNPEPWPNWGWPSSASMAMGSDGVLRVVLNNVNGVNYKMRYGRYVHDGLKYGRWKFETIPVELEPDVFPAYVSLSLGPDNQPHVAYSRIEPNGAGGYSFDVRTIRGFEPDPDGKDAEGPLRDPLPPPRFPDDLKEELLRHGIRPGTDAAPGNACTAR